MTTHSPAPGTPQTDHKARAAGNAAGPLGGASFILTALAMHYLEEVLPAVFGTPEAMIAVSGVVGGIVAYAAARIRAYQVPNQPMSTPIRNPQASRSGPLPCLVGLPLALVLLSGCENLGFVGKPDHDMTDEFRDREVTWPTASTAETMALIFLTELEARYESDFSRISEADRITAVLYCGYAGLLTRRPDVAEICARVDEAL